MERKGRAHKRLAFVALNVHNPVTRDHKRQADYEKKKAAEKRKAA